MERRLSLTPLRRAGEPREIAAAALFLSVESQLKALYEALNAGSASPSMPFEAHRALAPLPRVWWWLDGSAFESHGELMDKVLGIAPERTGRPLMYQGMSHRSDALLIEHSRLNTPDALECGHLSRVGTCAMLANQKMRAVLNQPAQNSPSTEVAIGNPQIPSLRAADQDAHQHTLRLMKRDLR